MRCLYNITFYLALPLIFGRLLWKAYKSPVYKKRWQERRAIFKSKALTNSIWVHAVSLGEAVAATPLIKNLQNNYPNTTIVVTAMTPTGSNHITKTFGNKIVHTYVPYDYSGAIKRFLNHINPRVLIIMETELWPNILYYCAQRHIPVVIANARLSKHSEQGYCKIKWFLRRLLSNINIIAAQSQIDAARFTNIGADPKKIQVVGNIKFDITLPKNILNDAKKLRTKWGVNRPIIIAASTHVDEDEQILTSLKIIKKIIPNILLILVPRHPERFTQVTELCQRENFKTISHKHQEPCAPNTDIIIGDTMGDLLLLYATSDVAFVGGSLVPHGGHNLLEPAALNIPIITGPHVANFIEISQLLTAANALITVKNSAELAQQIIKLLQNKNLSERQSAAALKVINQNKGALQKLMVLIGKYINK